MGGRHAGALLRPVPRPRRRLRAQVRDGGQPPPPARPVQPLARSRQHFELMQALLEHGADRRSAARSRRRRGPRRPRRRADRPLPALRSSTPATCGPASTAPRRSSRPPAPGGSSAHTPSGSATTPGGSGSREQFMADADAAGYGAGRCRSARSTSWARRGWAARPRCPPATRPARPGSARPLRARRLVVPHRVGSQPPDLDPGDRPHERWGSGREAAVAPHLPLVACPCSGAVGYSGPTHHQPEGEHMSEPAHVLVVAHQTAATPGLSRRGPRAGCRGPASFHLVVPRQAHGMHKLVDPQDAGDDEAQAVLDAALPSFRRPPDESPGASATPSR